MKSKYTDIDSSRVFENAEICRDLRKIEVDPQWVVETLNFIRRSVDDVKKYNRPENRIKNRAEIIKIRRDLRSMADTIERKIFRIIYSDQRPRPEVKEPGIARRLRMMADEVKFHENSILKINSMTTEHGPPTDEFKRISINLLANMFKGKNEGEMPVSKAMRFDLVSTIVSLVTGNGISDRQIRKYLKKDSQARIKKGT